MLLGDAVEAAKWLPFALARLKLLKKSPVPKKLYHPKPGISISLERYGSQEHVKIFAARMTLKLLDSSNGIYRMNPKAGAGSRWVGASYPRCAYTVAPGVERWLSQQKFGKGVVYEGIASDGGQTEVYSSKYSSDTPGCITLASLSSSYRRVNVGVDHAIDEVFIQVQEYADTEWSPSATLYYGPPTAPLMNTLGLAANARVSDIWVGDSTLLVEIDDAEGTGTFTTGGDEILTLNPRRLRMIDRATGAGISTITLGGASPASGEALFDGTDLIRYKNDNTTFAYPVTGGYAATHSNAGPLDTPVYGDGELWVHILDNLGYALSSVLVQTRTFRTRPVVIAKESELYVLVRETTQQMKAYRYTRSPVFDSGGLLVEDTLTAAGVKTVVMPGSYPVDVEWLR